MAARTFFDEFHFARIDLRLPGALRRRFGERLFDARRRGRYVAAAQRESDDAIGVLVLERGAARGIGPTVMAVPP